DAARLPAMNSRRSMDIPPGQLFAGITTDPATRRNSHLVERRPGPRARLRGRASCCKRSLMKRPALKNFRRIVVKVGSSLLVDQAKGEVRTAWLKALAADIAKLHGERRDVLVVSSGAFG